MQKVILKIEILVPVGFVKNGDMLPQYVINEFNNHTKAKEFGIEFIKGTIELIKEKEQRKCLGIGCEFCDGSCEQEVSIGI